MHLWNKKDMFLASRNANIYVNVYVHHFTKTIWDYIMQIHSAEAQIEIAVVFRLGMQSIPFLK